MAPPTTSPRKKGNKSRKRRVDGDKGHAASQKHTKDALPTGNETVVSQSDITHHHSNRSGAGSGGKITQLEKIGQVLKASQVRKLQGVAVLPEDTLQNPLALEKQCYSRGRGPLAGKKQVSHIWVFRN